MNGHEYPNKPQAPLIVSHTLPRAGIVTEDASWMEFLNRCEELAPSVGEQSRRMPYEKYEPKKRLVVSVRHGHWFLIDRKNGEKIAWGHEKTSQRAREVADRVRDAHVKQRCPKGNVL